MRIVLADIKAHDGFVSKDTVVGGYGSRLRPFSRVTKVICKLKRRFHEKYMVVDGTQGADSVTLTGAQADGITVEGLHALVRVFEADGPSDSLDFRALGGNDTVDATGVAAGIVSLILDGGAGADVLSGGPDTIVIP